MSEPIFGAGPQQDVGESLAQLWLKFYEMRNEQNAFQQALSEYLLSLAGQIANMAAQWLGNMVADWVGQIPYVGPLLRGLSQVFIPQLFGQVYRGLSL